MSNRGRYALPVMLVAFGACSSAEGDQEAVPLFVAGPVALLFGVAPSLVLFWLWHRADARHPVPERAVESVGANVLRWVVVAAMAVPGVLLWLYTPLAQIAIGVIYLEAQSEMTSYSYNVAGSVVFGLFAYPVGFGLLRLARAVYYRSSAARWVVAAVCILTGLVIHLYPLWRPPTACARCVRMPEPANSVVTAGLLLLALAAASLPSRMSDPVQQGPSVVGTARTPWFRSRHVLVGALVALMAVVVVATAYREPAGRSDVTLSGAIDGHLTKTATCLEGITSDAPGLDVGVEHASISGGRVTLRAVPGPPARGTLGLEVSGPGDRDYGLKEGSVLRFTARSVTFVRSVYTTANGLDVVTVNGTLRC